MSEFRSTVNFNSYRIKQCPLMGLDMGAISKIELTKQLQAWGIKVENNRVKKSDLLTALSSTETNKVIDTFIWKNKDVYHVAIQRATRQTNPSCSWILYTYDLNSKAPQPQSKKRLILPATYTSKSLNPERSWGVEIKLADAPAEVKDAIDKESKF